MVEHSFSAFDPLCCDLDYHVKFDPKRGWGGSQEALSGLWIYHFGVMKREVSNKPFATKTSILRLIFLVDLSGPCIT